MTLSQLVSPPDLNQRRPGQWSKLTLVVRASESATESDLDSAKTKTKATESASGSATAGG